MTLLCVESVGLSFRRGPKRLRVLRDVSFEVACGELFAVYGMRAAGKTTLLEVAAGLTAPDTGRVVFDGRDIASLSRRQFARLHRNGIAWVEREGPRAENVPTRVHVAVPLYRTYSRRKADARAVAILERVGAGDYADAYWVDLPDTARMSIAIAQALVRQPKLLVVDDPIYGLGVIEREAVIGLLREIAEDAGIAVLLAVPELPALLHATHMRVLANGKLLGPAEPNPPDHNIIDFPQSA